MHIPDSTILDDADRQTNIDQRLTRPESTDSEIATEITRPNKIIWAINKIHTFRKLHRKLLCPRADVKECAVKNKKLLKMIIMTANRNYFLAMITMMCPFQEPDDGYYQFYMGKGEETIWKSTPIAYGNNTRAKNIMERSCWNKSEPNGSGYKQCEDIFFCDDSIDDPPYAPSTPEFSSGESFHSSVQKPTANTEMRNEESIVLERNVSAVGTSDGSAMGISDGSAVGTSNGSASLQCKRKRKAEPSTWKNNIRKRLTQTGKSYISIRGKAVSARSVKPKDCSKCPKKCNSKFFEEYRQLCHFSFWNELGNIEKQKQYISSLVEVKPKSSVRTKAENSQRSNTREYYLVKEGNKIQVCQGFFLATFNISETFVKNILKNRSDCHVVQTSRRGRHPPGVARPEDAKEFIRSHIRSFPTVPSHYCRKSSTYEYLPQDLNVQKMYDMYVYKCNGEKIMPEKLWLYRQIFHNNFHLKFQVPRKDMCDTCFRYQNVTEDEKKDLQKNYEQHINRKNAAREFHDKAKADALENKINFIQFNLEAVRYCPVRIYQKPY
ncbi:unnamed protein product [Diabrotica balteata]|uniref:Uncharacterized protein n=1 Tax=Diabrotica balteata TaxID=107213 RepID=A0A9N9T869_DIABA|nr:unnamed protein product [Diabrotica balteata]